MRSVGSAAIGTAAGLRQDILPMPISVYGGVCGTPFILTPVATLEYYKAHTVSVGA